MPISKDPLVYDVVCVPTSTFQSAFVRNVTFHNYKNDYTADGFPMCGGNRAMHNHRSGHDASAPHFLTGTKCDSCSQDAFFT